MKTLRFAALFGVAAVALAVPSTVFAQDAEPPALVEMREQPDQQSRQRLVKIKNLPSATVAYMLDPQHNRRPASLGAADKSEVKGTFELPGSITRVVPFEPQNVLLTEGGSDEDIRRLQELIDVLDQPLRQIEIEAQVVQITPEDVKTFGIDFSGKRGGVAPNATTSAQPLTAQMGFVRNNFTARLNALIALGKAKIIAAPRVTALNNLSATLGLKTNIGPLTDDKFTYTFPLAGVDLKTTPTINGDDTITLLIDAPPLLALKSNLTSVINLRDGDTIALKGFSSLFAPVGAIDPPNTLIFITARIIRRAGDDDNLKIPGT